MTAWHVCKQELQDPRKTLPELAGSEAEQHRGVAELAAWLESGLP